MKEKTRLMTRTLTLAGATLLLSACVYAGSDFEPAPNAPQKNAAARSAPEILISTSEDVGGKPFQVIGQVTAYARSYNLWSPDPSLEDVNQALREEAAKQHADAVIRVHYQSHATGFASKGKMLGEGTAIVFTAP